MITMEVLLPLARDVELRIAQLYKDLALQFAEHPELETFFRRISREEEVHAVWVDAMFKGVPTLHAFPSLDAEDFSVLLSSIEDIHDEVRGEHVGLRGALEILLHLEASMAESFYEAIPEDTPGLAVDVRGRMIEACRKHADEVAAIRDAHAGALTGIHPSR